MSKRKDRRRTSQPPPLPGADAREQLLQTLSRRWQLGRAATEVLRRALQQCSVRKKLAGGFTIEPSGKLTVEQRIRIAAPLDRVSLDDRARVLAQLRRIGNMGKQIATIAAAALANPVAARGGKTPFDRYLAVCRNSGVHWGILRALEHLRDVISVTVERYFTDPSKTSITWRLHGDRVTAAMVRRVEECLRQVDASAIHAPACEQWITGFQRFFDEVKAGTFRLPNRVPAARSQIVAESAADGTTGSSLAPSHGSPAPKEPSDDAPQEIRELRQGLRALRQYLLPQYLDLPPEDFTTLCRSDRAARDFSRKLEGAIERFATHCLEAVGRKVFANRALAVAGIDAPQDAAAEIGNFVQRLNAECSSLRAWLAEELPQGEHSLGRRLVALAETSLVAGLFLQFLGQRYAELLGLEGGAHALPSGNEKARASRAAPLLQTIEAALARQRSAFADSMEKNEGSAVALDVVKYCRKALAALDALLRLAARCKIADAEEAPAPAARPAQRFLSAEGICLDAPEGRPVGMELVDYEPGVLPAVRCRYSQRAVDGGTEYETAEVCRFSRRGGVALSSEIAVPISALFGEESRLSRTASFLERVIDRHLAECQRVSRAAGVRECLPYLESHGLPLARVQVRGKDSAGPAALLALPADAMAMSDHFANIVSLPQAIERARRESPASEALLGAVAAYWRETGIDPADYALCTIGPPSSGEKPDASAVSEDLKSQRRVRHFLNQKARWPLAEAQEILAALGIVIEPKQDGAPHGRIRLGPRHHTLSSKLLKDGQVYATYLYEWIHTLGQDRLLADLLAARDRRLAPFMRKADAGQEEREARPGD